jgi:hypothetical protein
VPAEEGIANSIAGINAAITAGEWELFLGHFTDNGVIEAFGFPREQVLQALTEGGPQITPFPEPVDIQVSGDSAVVEIEAAPENAVETGSLYSFVNDGGDWKIEAKEYVAPELGDTTAVPVDLVEFAFEFSPTEITTGDIAFELANPGQQPHELALAQVPADADLLELLQQDEPEGVVFVGSLLPVLPGRSATMAFREPLAAGRYAMLCFLPNTDPALGEPGTPHVALGMVNEFTVPAGAEPTVEPTGTEEPSGVAEIRATLDEVNAAIEAQDVAAVLDHFTDDGVIATFGFPREQVLEQFGEDAGFTPLGEPSDIEASGDTGTVQLDLEPTDNVATEVRWSMVRVDDAWLVDGAEYVSEALGPDTTAVGVELTEMAFNLDTPAAASGDLAFDMTNTGAQTHELVLFGVPADADILELLQQEEPEGVVFAGVIAPVLPGQSAQMRFVEPLEAGRYALVCFLPNTDETLGEVGTPHAFLGMVNEFSVGTP